MQIRTTSLMKNTQTKTKPTADSTYLTLQVSD